MRKIRILERLGALVLICCLLMSSMNLELSVSAADDREQVIAEIEGDSAEKSVPLDMLIPPFDSFILPEAAVNPTPQEANTPNPFLSRLQERNFTLGDMTLIDVSAGGLETAIKADLVANAGQTGPNYDYKVITGLVITGTLDTTDFAFIREKLSNLTSIDLSGISNTSLPKNAFNNNPNYASGNMNNLKTVVLLNDMTTLGNSAFYGCSALEDVNLSNVATLGDNAFYGCEALEGVDLGNLTTLGDNAFFNCQALEGVDLGNVTMLGNAAFYGCTKLTLQDGTNLNVGLTTIPSSAFEGCEALEGIDLSNVTTLGGSAFYGCTKLTLQNGTNLNVGLTSISNNAFFNCEALEGIDLSNVTTINYLAFRGCVALEAVDLSNVTTLGSNAFYGCTKLTLQNGTNLNVGLTTILNNAFYGCEALEGVDLSNVTTLGNNAFSGCETLEAVDLSNVTTLGSDAFSGCTKLTLQDGTNLNVGLTTIRSYAFSGCEALEGVDLSNVTVLGYSAFSGCTKLTLQDGTNLNVGLTMILSFTFSGCEALEGVDLSNVTVLENNAFSGCTKLTLQNGTNLNVGLTTIRSYAFSGCEALEGIDLSNVTTLGDHAFSGCTKLTLQNGTNLNVGLTTIPSSAFSGCEALEGIDLSNVTTLGGSAFSGCTKLTLQSGTNLNVGLTTIPSSAFSGCEALEGVNLSNVTTLGVYAFKGCTKLTLQNGTNLNVGLTIIPSFTFSGCEAFEGIDLSNVTTLGDHAFSGCTSLTAIVLPATKPEIGANAFTDVPALLLLVKDSGIYDNLSGFPAGSSYPTILGSDTLNVGGAISLAISPNVGDVVSYQWKKGGTNIVGATEQTFTQNNVQLTDNGSVYTCEITLAGTTVVTTAFTLTVIQPVTSVTLNKMATTLIVGDDETLMATVAPSDATNKNVTWSSSDTGVATVGANGEVHAKSVGTAMIKVSTADGGKTAVCVVTVNPVLVTGVSLNKTSTTLAVGGSETLTATVAPSDATNKNITWSSSDTAVATVDANGKVIAVAAGTATITATTVDGNKTATCAVMVTKYNVLSHFDTYKGAGRVVARVDAPHSKFVRILVDGVEIDSNHYTIASGSTIIMLKESHLATLADGTYTVIAEFSDGTAALPLKVKLDANVVRVESVALTKTNMTLGMNETLQLTATVSPSDATNQSVVWESSDKHVAMVDENGKVTGIKEGTATITTITNDGDYQATCTITVRNSSAEIPETGDYSQMTLWFTLALLGLLGVLYILVRRKWQGLKSI